MKRKAITHSFTILKNNVPDPAAMENKLHSAGVRMKSRNRWILKSCLTFILVVASFQFTSAQTVTIGTVAPSPIDISYTHGPIVVSGSSSSNNSRHAYLYTAAELSIPAGSIITSLAWQKASNNTLSGNNTFKVYLENTTNTTLPSGTAWSALMANATQVYNSTNQSITGGYWVFNSVATNNITSFVYNGGNLIISVEHTLNATPTGRIEFVVDPAAGMAIGAVSTTPFPSSSTLSATTYGNKRPTIRISYTPGVVCTSPPTGAQAVASVTSICPNTNFQLSLTGLTSTSGLTYQWQVSNGAGWADIPGATNSSVNLSQTVTSFYRAQLTCSGQTASSAPVQVTNTGAAISGNITVNKNAPVSATSFQTIGAAFASLNCGGVNGSLSINIAPGTGPYNEQVVITEIPGTSAINTVRLNGNNNTISVIPSGQHLGIITLDGADFIKLENLVIAPPGPNGGIGVQLKNAANNNVISGCTINMPVGNNSGNYGIYAGTTGSTSGNNTNNSRFQGNTITGGYNGIIINGNTGGTDALNNQIIDNIFTDNHYSAISLSNTDGTLVEFNNISRPTKINPSQFFGIYLTEGNRNTIVSKNRIHNLFGANPTSTNSAMAIYHNNADAPVGSENVVSNNLIYNINTNGAIYALYNQSSNGVHYFHNTVDLSHATNNNSVRGFFQTFTASNIRFFNNIIRIHSGASGNKHALYFDAPASGINSNNNVLHVASTVGGHYLGFFGSNQPDLTSWQAVNSGAFDQNSVDADPAFFNPAAGDFLPTNAAGINRTGQAVPTITDDFNNIYRDPTAPDPGAYELKPAIIANGPATFCQGSSVILAAATPGTGITFQWFKDGTAIPGATGISYNATTGGSYTVSANLSAGASSSIPTLVTVNQKPATPGITQAGNILTASAATGATYQWYSVTGTTLTAVTGATSQSFTPPTNGGYTVKITVNGCESDAAATLSVVLGISSLAPGMDVAVYPNPTAGRFAVELTGFEKEATVLVMNVTGQVIASETVVITAEKTAKAFDLGGVPKGVYILKVTSGDNLTFRKLIVE